MKKFLTTIALLFQLISAASALAVPPQRPSSSAVGWGNLLVPGLGATLRDRPVQGLTEATLSIGTYYGGAQIAEEGRFKIDGSVVVPESGNVSRALSARMLQQFGLKYHFYNTFHHYQQSALENFESEAEKEKERRQPLYRGDWKDMLVAPFQLENILSPWSWPVILAVTGYLAFDYSRAKVAPRRFGLSPMDEALYGVSNMAVIPVGSSFGEDPLFRGFMQREVHGLTGSLTLGIISQSALFALLHQDHLTSLLVGGYFGLETHFLKGDLGPAMATHFWINVAIGLFDYWVIKRSQGKGVPLSPPIGTAVSIPF